VDYNHYVDDFLLFVSHVQTTIFHNRPLPCFLLGHSFGGALSVLVARSGDRPSAPKVWQWTGVIFSAPALLIDPKVATPFLQFVSRWLSILLPQFQPLKLDPNLICRERQVVYHYQHDPLISNIGGVPARYGYELLRLQRDIRTNMASVEFPFLLLQGGCDALVAPAGAEQFYRDAPAHDKTIKIYPDLYHELVSEPQPDRQLVLKDLLGWIDAKCQT